jgi:hypothetical protein
MADLKQECDSTCDSTGATYWDSQYGNPSTENELHNWVMESNEFNNPQGKIIVDPVYGDSKGRPDSSRNLSAESVTEFKLQLEAVEILPEDLVKDAEGIYAGLVMVEENCIQVVLKLATLALKAAPGPPPKMANEQYKALGEMHIALLKEHVDLFLASQHPIAPFALQSLTKNNEMLTRLWCHGIHSLLEVLRDRLPESMDNMLVFIYQAYSIMTFLYETVPAFKETWMERLGDLARYRMAIGNGDIQACDRWAQVSREWYLKLLDRSPQTGRLYHHLALACPNALQRLYLYVKAVSVPDPFAAANDSMNLFFQPFLRPTEEAVQPTVTAYIKVHAYLASQKSSALIEEFILLLDNHIDTVTQTFLE